MNNYEARWLNARKVCSTINKMLEKDDLIRIEWDGQVFLDGFDIDDEYKEITLDSENSSHLIFSGDPQVDEGVYATQSLWTEKFKERCKLLKEIPYKV